MVILEEGREKRGLDFLCYNLKWHRQLTVPGPMSASSTGYWFLNKIPQ